MDSADFSYSFLSRISNVSIQNLVFLLLISSPEILLELCIWERCSMGMPELGSTSVSEPTSPPKKQLQIDSESDIVQDHLGLKSQCARQKVAKPILVQPSSIIVATKSVSCTQKLRMLLPAARHKGFASSAAGLSHFRFIVTMNIRRFP